MLTLYEKEIVERFKGKNVILVGPSGNVVEDCKNIDVDSYDLVCRVNNHGRLISKYKNIGKRTDFIFHHLNVRSYTRADVNKWAREKTMIISRNQLNIEHQNKVNFLNKLKHPELSYTYIDKDYFDKKREELDTTLNTGTIAMVILLELPIKSLTVVGFDFFETYYINHKRNFNRTTGHNPLRQQVQFSKYLYDNKKVRKKFHPVGRMREIIECEFDKIKKSKPSLLKKVFIKIRYFLQR